MAATALLHKITAGCAGGTSSTTPPQSTSPTAEQKDKDERKGEGEDNMAATAPTQPEEEGKQFVARYSDNQHPLPPSEILEDPQEKDLGCQSRALSIRDFELVRTLGTGARRFATSSPIPEAQYR